MKPFPEVSLSWKSARFFLTGMPPDNIASVDKLVWHVQSVSTKKEKIIGRIIKFKQNREKQYTRDIAFYSRL